MRKAVLASLIVTFVFYVSVGLLGYAALGDLTPGNILTGFETPAGVVRAANAMVLVHMVRRTESRGWATASCMPACQRREEEEQQAGAQAAWVLLVSEVGLVVRAIATGLTCGA